MCDTKNSVHARYIMQKFCEGLKSGIFDDDSFELVNDYNDIAKIKSCNVSFQTCTNNFSLKNKTDLNWKLKSSSWRKKGDTSNQYHLDGSINYTSLRYSIIKHINDYGVVPIVAEAGYIGHIKWLDFGSGRSNPGDIYESYVSLGVGGIKRDAMYFNNNMPKDRYIKLHKKIKSEPLEWRKDGTFILILGQNPLGVGTTNIRKMGYSYEDWMIKTIKDIQKHTDRPIVYKPHPYMVKNRNTYSMWKKGNKLANFIQSGEGVCHISPHKNIKDSLRDCWCVVTSASNASIDAVWYGVPVLTQDPMSMVYDISSNNISEVEYPYLHDDMCQFFYDLCYAQWKPEEIASGEAWSHIREGIINENLLSKFKKEAE